MPPLLFDLLLVLAALTMIAGVLGAVSQYHIRRILSFHIISQIGYMVMGLGLLAAPVRTITVVGTNGKGSVAYSSEAMLRAAGQRTGG